MILSLHKQINSNDMIKGIRIARGYNSIASFAKDCEISVSRYYNIERLLITATGSEFARIGGDDYEAYLIEVSAKKTLMFTSRMENFAAYCGNPTPCETVRRYFAENRF